MTESITQPARETSRHYEVFGRVMQALRSSECSPQSSRNFDWWTTLEGHIALEWFEGPHPGEVANALIMRAAYSEELALHPGDARINAEQNRPRSTTHHRSLRTAIPAEGDKSDWDGRSLEERWPGPTGIAAPGALIARCVVPSA